MSILNSSELIYGRSERSMSHLDVQKTLVGYVMHISLEDVSGFSFDPVEQVLTSDGLYDFSEIVGIMTDVDGNHVREMTVVESLVYMAWDDANCPMRMAFYDHMCNL